jgi:RDD family/Short C-terminal domain
MASRLSRLTGWLVNALIFIFTLVIGWVIWWFIVAPRGQSPGKALVGTRVIRTDGRAAKTGWMFVRGLVGLVFGVFPFGFLLDSLWLLWDRDAQTLHDKLAGTVVVRAGGSEHVVEQGSVGPYPAGVQPPPYEPPVSFPSSAGPTPSAAEDLRRLQELRDQNLITEDEYEAKRKAIIDRL